VTIRNRHSDDRQGLRALHVRVHPSREPRLTSKSPLDAADHRGDLAAVLYEAARDTAEFLFDDTIVAGYAIYDVATRDEAIEWTTRFMELHRRIWPGWDGQSEIRQIIGPRGQPTTRVQLRQK
jgi:hypothetical protein